MFESRALLGTWIRHAAAPAILLIPCLAATAAGFFLLQQFNGTAAPQHSAPPVWPRSSELVRPANRPQILVFLHPFCSCSRATLHELARVIAQVQRPERRPRIDVLFVRTEEKWPEGDLWRQATGIPGAIARWDEGARAAALFSARTSGVVLLYGVHGELLFQGGVTGSRGHEGDNFGASRLLTALETGRPVGIVSQVFGCALARAGQRDGAL